MIQTHWWYCLKALFWFAGQSLNSLRPFTKRLQSGIQETRRYVKTVFMRTLTHRGWAVRGRGCDSITQWFEATEIVNFKSTMWAICRECKLAHLIPTYLEIAFLKLSSDECPHLLPHIPYFISYFLFQARRCSGRQSVYRLISVRQIKRSRRTAQFTPYRLC